MALKPVILARPELANRQKINDDSSRISRPKLIMATLGPTTSGPAQKMNKLWGGTTNHQKARQEKQARRTKVKLVKLEAGLPQVSIPTIALLICFLGVVVGGTVIVLFLPYFKLFSVVA